MKELDDAIDEHLIKYLVNNYAFTDIERKWFSLPARLGGLGINIPSEISDIYYRNSRRMTEGLVGKIINQHKEITTEENSSPDALAAIKEEKKQREEDKVSLVKQHLNPEKLKVYE